jgi:polysaccharide export outer membrane protein
MNFKSHTIWTGRKLLQIGEILGEKVTLRSMKGHSLFISLNLLVLFIALSSCGGMPFFEDPAPPPEVSPVEETTVNYSLPQRSALIGAHSKEYRIGVDDEVEISVYGQKELKKTQDVRPDGNIAFPLIGDVQASGLTPDELRDQIEQKLSEYVRSPSVTVVIVTYKSKKVSILGEVKTPGLLRLSSEISMLEGISRVGGITDNADLQGSMLVRDGKILPVNFKKLLRQGDLTQNVILKSEDVVLIPNVSLRKIFVLGEVKKPKVISLKDDVTLIESISRAGGFTRIAESRNVIIVRGGLGNPRLMKVDVNQITRNGKVVYNVPLAAGDIVYVPKTLISNVVQFFVDMKNILDTILIAESGIILWPDVRSVLETGDTTGAGGGVVISP